MRLDVKLVFIVLLALLQISYVDGWWGGSSRSSSSSRRSPSWRRPSWRRPTRQSPTRRRSSNRRSSSWGSSGSRSPASETRPHDIKTKAGLTNLFNKQVVRSQRVERPLQTGGLGKLGIPHSGQLVTTKDGSKHLVHNSGKGTVVTDAKHMSSKWKADGKSKNVGGKATIGKFVKEGGPDYNLMLNNCHDATKRMGELGRKKRCVG